MQKRFIVLLDLSEHSANLLKYAYDWSRRVPAQILLVHHTAVLAPALADETSREDMVSATHAKALRKLRELKKAVLPHHAEVQYAVSHRPLMLALSELLAEPFENIILAGLKGTGLLKKLFIGSVALKVIEHTDSIIVAIPKDISKFSAGKIYVAVSDKHPLNILALNNFFGFLKGGVKNVTFFYLAKPNEKTEKIEKQLSDLSKLFGDKFKTSHAIYKGEDAFKNIKKVINNRTEELLIVQEGSRMLTDQLFRKFMINELVYEGETPLVVLP